MAESKHYCRDCDTHLRCSIETHAEVAHDGFMFRGIENGDFRDWQRVAGALDSPEEQR